MRSTLSILLLVVALAACQAPAPPAPAFTPSDEAAVRKNLDDYTPLTMAKNWDGIVPLYTSDAVRFPPNEPAIQHDAMKAWLENYPLISEFETPTDHFAGSANLPAATGP